VDRREDTAVVIDLPHGPSGLSQAAWTDADFAAMGWHDCRIHAISIGEYDDGTLPPARLMLDLDYIVRWVSCSKALGTSAARPLHEVMEIADIHRLGPPDDSADPLWHVEDQNFDLRLRAAGYTQVARLPPQHVPRQVLTSAERSGISFAEESFA
jgi:hypothetical protein